MEAGKIQKELFETIKTEDSLKVTSFFRITGNPRNESQIYGVNSHKAPYCRRKNQLNDGTHRI